MIRILRGRGGLLRQHDFRHLWAADVISQLGSRISMFAVPLLAVLGLGASTLEVSLLRTAEMAASLLFGLFAGAWVDRLRCRPVLIAADLARAALLGSIPIAALAGVLHLGQLYVVVFLAGVGTVLFDTAHTTYLPRLIGRGHLVEGNSRLAANTSVAAVAGSGIGGYLVQWLTAPLTIALDAVSYLWSALWLRSIRTPEASAGPGPADAAPPRHLRREIGEGLRFVFGHPILRPIAANTATVLFFQAANDSVMIVFLVREIHLSAGAIGLLGMVGLLGALASAALTGRIAARLGSARTLLLSALVNGVGFLLYPLTAAGPRLAFYVFAGGLAAFSIVTRHIMVVTARQRLCPDRLLGRVSATMELMTTGVMPVGALAGGLLATLLGFRFAFLLDGAAIALASLWLIASPLRRLRDIPEPAPVGACA